MIAHSSFSPPPSFPRFQFRSVHTRRAISRDHRHCARSDGALALEMTGSSAPMVPKKSQLVTYGHCPGLCHMVRASSSAFMPQARRTTRRYTPRPARLENTSGRASALQPLTLNATSNISVSPQNTPLNRRTKRCRACGALKDEEFIRRVFADRQRVMELTSKYGQTHSHSN